jgi:hypothetical protein
MYSQNAIADDESDYFGTSSFITRVIITIVLFAAWLTAAIAIDINSNDGLSPDIQGTRIAFLVISVVAFVECVIILIICLSSYACNILVRDYYTNGRLIKIKIKILISNVAK